MSDLSQKIAGGSNILADGQRFLFEQLGIGEEQLTLIGKLAWMKTDEKVSHVYYNAGAFCVRFKNPLSVNDFEQLLSKYEISSRYDKWQDGAVIISSSVSPMRIYFNPLF